MSLDTKFLLKFMNASTQFLCFSYRRLVVEVQRQAPVIGRAHSEKGCVRGEGIYGRPGTLWNQAARKKKKKKEPQLPNMVHILPVRFLQDQVQAHHLLPGWSHCSLPLLPFSPFHSEPRNSHSHLSQVQVSSCHFLTWSQIVLLPLMMTQALFSISFIANWPLLASVLGLEAGGLGFDPSNCTQKSKP